MKFWVSTLSTFIIVNSAVASSGGGHDVHGGDSHGIPTVVYYQALNVAIILIAAVVFGKKSIAAFFAGKKEGFLKAQEKAQGVLRSAEEEYQQMKERHDKLLMNRDESIAKATADANDLRAQIVRDAEALAQKLNNEAHLSSKLEIERAKHELKEQLIRDAFELSKRDLGSKATSADQKKLQDDFISKVQVVQ
ncbi:MAG: synthase chain [Pseudomonadota bacterium]|jgi:F-type H+-transporting ATPase subunit b